MGEEDLNWKILQNLREAAVFSRDGLVETKRNQATTLGALRALRWGLQDLVASSGASDSFEVGWLEGKRWAEHCMKGMGWLVIGTQRVGT